MPFDSTNADLTVIPVTTPEELKRFIALPARLNAKDPNWITPLMMERTEALTPKTNPFFAHAEVQLFLATRGGRDVGRISAQIDQLTPQPTPGRLDGHFGMIAAEDDPAVFHVLFRAAEDWLRARGRTHVVGPFNLSINEEVGLLVEGFDTPPMILMGHDPAYAGKRVEEQGYAKAQDVFAYGPTTPATSPRSPSAASSAACPTGVVLRQLDMKRYDEEVQTLTDILNDAWSDNWGFTPTTEAETAQLGKALKQVIDKRLIWFAEIDGEAGRRRGLPAQRQRGHRRPEGQAAAVRLGQAAVAAEGQGREVGPHPADGREEEVLDHPARPHAAVLDDEGQPRYRDGLGYNRFEISWVLEANKAMTHIAENVGGTHYKTYRVYEKAL
jgi:hypothetical protein